MSTKTAINPTFQQRIAVMGDNGEARFVRMHIIHNGKRELKLIAVKDILEYQMFGFTSYHQLYEACLRWNIQPRNRMGHETRAKRIPKFLDYTDLKRITD